MRCYLFCRAVKICIDRITDRHCDSQWYSVHRKLHIYFTLIPIATLTCEIAWFIHTICQWITWTIFILFKLIALIYIFVGDKLTVNEWVFRRPNNGSRVPFLTTTIQRTGPGIKPAFGTRTFIWSYTYSIISFKKVDSYRNEFEQFPLLPQVSGSEHFKRLKYGQFFHLREELVTLHHDNQFVSA